LSLFWIKEYINTILLFIDIKELSNWMKNLNIAYESRRSLYLLIFKERRDTGNNYVLKYKFTHRLGNMILEY